MAVGTPANLTAGLSTTDASSFVTASFTPTANAKLLAWINVGHRTITPNEPTSLTGHGVTWTMVTEVTTSNNTWNCSLWEATASASPSAGTLTFNLGATAESATWRVIEATGAQIVQHEVLATSATNPSLTLDNAIGSGGVTVGILMNNNSSTTITAGSGYTDLGSQQSTATAPVFKGAAEYNMTGSTTVNFTASGTVVRALLGLELGPAGTQYSASGTVAATTTASGSTALRAAASGSVAGSTAASGSTTLRAAAAGAAAAVTAVAGTAVGLYPATGTVAASTTTSASTTALRPASGTAAATSGTSGAVGKLYPAEGSVAVTSGLSGEATALLPATGTADAESGAVGATTAILPATTEPVEAVSGTSGSASIIGGPQQYPAAGTVAAVSTTTGAAGLLAGASGTIAATSDTSGSTTALYVVSGTVEAVSGTAGEAEVITAPPPGSTVRHVTVGPARSRYTVGTAAVRFTVGEPNTRHDAGEPTLRLSAGDGGTRYTSEG